MDTRLLTLLRCPVSKQRLRVVNDDELATINNNILGGGISNIGGDVLDAPIDGALITYNASTIYPVLNGIPVMLESMGIANILLDQPLGKKV